jgi:hypothetical protein
MGLLETVTDFRLVLSSEFNRLIAFASSTKRTQVPQSVVPF